VIESVERFGAELERQPVAHPEQAAHREVQVLEGRRNQVVAAGVAESSCRRERKRPDIDPLLRGVRPGIAVSR